MESLRSFCQFQQYGADHERVLFSPCSEFLLLWLSHLALLLSLVVRFTLLSSLRPASVPPSSSSSPLLLLFSSASSSLLLVLQLVLLRLPPLLLIAYLSSAIVWANNAILQLLAFRQNCHIILPFSSSSFFLLLLPHSLVTFVFALISLHRSLSFGLFDLRSLLPILLFLLQLLPPITLIIRRRLWPIDSNSQRWRSIGANGDGVQSPRREISLERIHEQANWLSQLFFWWTNPLLEKGYRGELSQVANVFLVPPSLDLALLRRALLPSPSSVPSNFSMGPALFRAFGRPFLLLGLLRFVGDIAKFASPVLLHLLINSLQESSQSLNTGYLCAVLMFLALLMSSVCDFHFNYHIQMVALRAKTSLLIAVYEKLLQIPAFRLTGTFSSGNLVNLMSSDVDRIGGMITSFHAFWSMPMNFAIALYLLHRELGLAFLTGLLVSVLLIPLNKYIASKIGHFSNKMMQMKDARMKLVSELARSMRTVKLNNWEPFFEAKIGQLRSRELDHLRRIKYLDAVCVYLWASAPVVITVLMLATYSLVLQEVLTAAKVFTTLALIGILIMPLNAFPWVLSAIINGMVSKRRYDAFFAIRCDDNQQQQMASGGGEAGEAVAGEVLLQLEGCSFAWNEERCAVRDIAFDGRKGMLVGIVGPVGSGKSSLLLGLLGETMAPGPRVRVHPEVAAEGFAYVGQDVWLREGTIRENVQCERDWDPELFREAIEACALSLDIQTLPGGDGYRISGDGTTLSGGQKLRLALARAVYADKRVFLLDDPFAALDRAVARFVYDRCVRGMLLGRGKLVLLCTHHEQFLREADLVIRLNAGGEPELIGKAEEVLGGGWQGEEDNLLKSVAGTEEAEETPVDAVEHVGAEEAEEEKEMGAVKLRVYVSYLRAVGVPMSLLILVALLAMQLTRNGSDVWLSRWASASSTNGSQLFGAVPEPDWSFPLHHRPVWALPSLSALSESNFFLSVYVGLALLNTLCTLIRAFSFAFGLILAAKSLHQRIISRILNATLTWWDRTPCGRVTNRLSSDVNTVDDALPFQLNILLASLFSLLATLLVTVLALPLLAPLVLLLFLLYFLLQRYYRRTTVELRRITALSLSPLYTHLTETVSGLVSIRALRISHRFSSLMRDRLHHNLRAQFSQLACSQWLSVRTQLLGVLIVSVVAFASVFDVHLFHLSNPGLIGLAITYALSFTGIFNGLLCSFIETEKELVSVERICDYVENVPTEGGGEEQDPGADAFGRIVTRQIHGQIRFTGVSLRYAPDLPLAIRDLTFYVEAGHRVAIIGRTGSGKSTILQALLRATPIETGKIHIDEVIDLESLGLRSARSMFGFVSQQPFLFSGSLRDNLLLSNSDPSLPADDDSHLLECISRLGLGPWLAHFGGLEAAITEGGRNLSFGERQLIALFRLALAHPRIILIDEATAHMDEQTHQLMSQLITRMDCTILSILHRTSGLSQFDWIIEMSNGQIARQGPPAMFIKGNGRVEGSEGTPNI